MAVKVDLEKAYDMIDWQFLEDTLCFFDFPSSWVQLIMFYLHNSRTAVLINGEPTEYFAPTRGLRQGTNTPK
ncbi:unnamed protein product [Linum tenue]|uniref:Reverse transcriptase domain-containing protein n=1 Tax=Linum tenue TaxID=586396 RepID=A0AAV0Q5H6_9ROSI|nr:unnamed protein product [Linum tenue]